MIRLSKYNNDNNVYKFLWLTAIKNKFGKVNQFIYSKIYFSKCSKCKKTYKRYFENFLN